MPQPLQNPIQWSDWIVPNGGIDESKSDHELEPKKWSKSFDVEPLPSGCRARNGKAKVNATAISGTPAITGILDYRLSDSTTERLLVVAGAEVYKEVSGTMTAVSPGAGTFTPNPDNHPAMTVGSDTAFISNGIETPKKFYIRSAVERWANDGIAAPTQVPLATAASGVGSPPLAVGTWSIDYYYWNADLGTKSNTCFQGASTLTVTLTAGVQSIFIINLPTGVARVGDRATHLRISLKSPTSGLFRYAGEVSLETTTATITNDVTTNEPDYDDDPALIHSIATVGANQRFIAGFPASPWRVMASKVSILGAFYESFPALNYRDFGKGDGDYVTALAFISPATLIVGMKNSVWALDARRFLTSDPVLISKNVGIAGKNAFMVIGRSLFFVSDSDRTKGLMAWNGSQVTPLVAIDKTFKGMQPTRLKYASCGHLAPGDDRFQWWTLLTESGSSPNRVIVYDYSLDAFSVYRHSGNVLGSAVKSGGISKIKVGGTNGILYDADSGTTDDGTQIAATFTSKRLDFGAPDLPKRVRFIRAEGDGLTNSSLNVKYTPDVQGFASFSGSLDFNGGTGSYLGAGVLGAFLMGSTTPIISQRISMVGVCRNVQPEFSSSSRWSLRGFTQGVQVLRRRA